MCLSTQAKFAPWKYLMCAPVTSPIYFLHIAGFPLSKAGKQCQHLL